MFDITHFHQYTAGPHVFLITDHKSHLGIMCCRKQIQQALSPRRLRWYVILSTYDYELLYRERKRQQNADALSRLPLASHSYESVAPGAVLMITGPRKPALSAEEIAKLTVEDSSLRSLRICKQYIEYTAS